MQRRFSTAVEATVILSDLRKQAKQLNYNKDLIKLLSNADKLVGILGNAEVKARQTHRENIVIGPREDLANAIDYCEKMLLILRLTQ